MTKIIQLAKSTICGKSKEDIYPKTLSEAVVTDKPTEGSTLKDTLDDLYSTNFASKVHIVLIDTGTVNDENVAFFVDAQGELDTEMSYAILYDWINTGDIVILRTWSKSEDYMLSKITYNVNMCFSKVYCWTDNKATISSIYVKPDVTYFKLNTISVYKPLEVTIASTTTNVDVSVYNEIISEISEFGRPIYVKYIESGISYNVPLISVRTDLYGSPIQFGVYAQESALGNPRYIGISIYEDGTVGIAN